MEEINTVTAISQKDGKYGVALGKDNWYGGMGTCPCKKGDKVKVTFEINGRWKNIKDLQVLDNSGYKPEFNTANRQSGIEETARLRRKTDCLRMAVDLCIAEQIKLDEVEERAKSLSDFVETQA